MIGGIRALVVDDDPLSRQRLCTLIEKEPDLELAGTCVDGEEAVASIASLRPDLLFLDVEMPRRDGFGVVDAVGAERLPTTIFISAYAEFAVRAFEAYALDYLLKPFGDERFQQALERARQQVHARTAGSDLRIVSLLDHLKGSAPDAYPAMLAVKTGGQYVMVRTDDIDWIEADDNYARLHLRSGGVRLLNRSLTALESKVLDPRRFVRVHRSSIVNLARIVSLEPLFHGEMSVVLDGGARVACSRRYRSRLEERVYFTS